MARGSRPRVIVRYHLRPKQTLQQLRPSGRFAALLTIATTAKRLLQHPGVRMQARRLQGFLQCIWRMRVIPPPQSVLHGAIHCPCKCKPVAERAVFSNSAKWTRPAPAASPSTPTLEFADVKSAHPDGFQFRHAGLAKTCRCRNKFVDRLASASVAIRIIWSSIDTWPRPAVLHWPAARPTSSSALISRYTMISFKDGRWPQRW